MESVVRQLTSGLDTEMLLATKHFTEGQKFLLALARALLANTKVLAIDEVRRNNVSY
jgi:ABC-type multidrug transport system fused ATPase/permease subunit